MTTDGQQGTNTNNNSNNRGRRRGQRKLLTMLPLIEEKRINTVGYMVEAITLLPSVIQRHQATKTEQRSTTYKVDPMHTAPPHE